MYKYVHVNMYVYIYICVCVCVCVYIYIYIYIYIYQGSTVRPFQSHLRLNITRCDYEKIFRSTSATDPISILVFVLRELQRFLTYLRVFAALSNVSDISSHYNKV